MKYKLTLILAALLCVGPLTPTISQAASVVVELGDRPYYSHGPYYWHHRTRYVWVPGHWRWRYGHRVWVHGYYAPHHGYYAPRYYRY